MLYFAYGSNLDYTRMLNRCKSAEVYEKATLIGYKLVFMENNSGRVVANLVEDFGGITTGIIYDLSDSDIKVLDRYEGYPYVYNRVKVDITYKGKEISCITYIMAEEYEYKTKYSSTKITRGYGVPKQEYFKFLLNGYTMFDLPQNRLLEAYMYSKMKGETK